MKKKKKTYLRWIQQPIRFASTLYPKSIANEPQKNRDLCHAKNHCERTEVLKFFSKKFDIFSKQFYDFFLLAAANDWDVVFQSCCFWRHWSSIFWERWRKKKKKVNLLNRATSRFVKLFYVLHDWNQTFQRCLDRITCRIPLKFNTISIDIHYKHTKK